MGSTIDDKYIKFVIENFKDIKALLEVLDNVKMRLPAIIDEFISESIWALREKDFKKLGLIMDKDSNCVSWWHPAQYNWDRELDEGTGAYFAYYFDHYSWENFIEKDTKEPLSFDVSVQFDTIRKKADVRKYIDNWNKLLISNKTKVEEKNIRLLPVDYGNPTHLCSRILQREVNLEALKNLDKMRKDIQQAAIESTSVLLPILQNRKKGWKF